MLNPNTHVRIGIINALVNVGVDVPIWAKVVPKDVPVVPSMYILISSQSKAPIEISKGCWEWEVTTVLSLFKTNNQGFTNTIPLDTLEEKVLTAMERTINVPKFMVKNTQLIDTVPLDFETPTQTIERTVMTYTQWLEEKED